MVPCYQTVFFLNGTLTIKMLGFETLSRLETVLRQYFHCLGFGLKGHCFDLDLGLEYTTLVSCLVETFIKTVGHNANCTSAVLAKVVILS